MQTSRPITLTNINECNKNQLMGVQWKDVLKVSIVYIETVRTKEARTITGVYSTRYETSMHSNERTPLPTDYSAYKYLSVLFSFFKLTTSAINMYICVYKCINVYMCICISLYQSWRTYFASCFASDWTLQGREVSRWEWNCAIGHPRRIRVLLSPRRLFISMENSTRNWSRSEYLTVGGTTSE